jgi:hypothetical protein
MSRRDEEYERMAHGLEEVAAAMCHYARVLRGEEVDYTGRGQWAILCGHLEEVMGVKVITKEQYSAFLALDPEGRR